MELAHSQSVFNFEIGIKQHDIIINPNCTKDETFTHKVGDLFLRKIDHSDDLSVLEFFFRVSLCDLGRGFQNTNLRSEVNLQLIGRIPGFGKIGHCNYGSHPHFYFFKVIPGDKIIQNLKFKIQDLYLSKMAFLIKISKNISRRGRKVETQRTLKPLTISHLFYSKKFLTKDAK